MTWFAMGLLVFAAFDPIVAGGRLEGIAARLRHLGTMAGAAVAAGLVWVALPLLDWLQVEPESFWIAAGLVLAATGVVRVAVWRGIGPTDPGDADHWLVPITYPVVLGPELVLASLAAGTHDDVVAATVALAAAALVVAVPLLPGPPGSLVRSSTARSTAAVQVVLAIALIIDGVRGV